MLIKKPFKKGRGGVVAPHYYATGSPADAAETTAFLARTSGLDATHVNAYKALINGLVSDGVFAKQDAIYIFATDTSANALLSLVSSTYNATAVSAPTFTADAGFSNASGTHYVDSNFNPSTAVSPKFVQNSQSQWAWSNTSTLRAKAIFGNSSGTNGRNYIYPRSTSDFTWYGPQDGGYMTAANTDGKGLYLANRSGASAKQGYQNGISVATGSTASLAVTSATFSFLRGDGGDFVGQVMAGGFGQSLDATENANLYARVHTYLQTIAGIP